MSILLSRPLLTLTHRFGQTSHPYPLEGLLRPAVELNTALLTLAAAAAFWLTPQVFLMGSVYGAMVGAILSLFGLRRLAQGLFVLQYQRIINDCPLYTINVDLLAKVPGQVLLGRGFSWRNIHTQRLYDLTRIESFERYLKCHEQNPVGGRPEVHGVGAMAERDMFLSHDDRIGHVLIYGQSRSGKTRLIEMLIEQDIASGHAVILIDPKGDAELFKRVLVAARRSGRMGHVQVLDLGFVESSVRYNPVGSWQAITEVAGRIATQLPNSGDGQAFANFAWRFVFIVAKALDELKMDITVESIKRHVMDFSELFRLYSAMLLKRDRMNVGSADELLKYFADNPQDNDVLNGIISAFSYEKSYYDKITASLLPFLEKLTALGAAVSPDGKDDLPELKLEDSIINKKIVVLKLDGLSDHEIAHAFGAMFLSDLVSLAGKLYKTREQFDPIYVHADEFNDVIGDDFLPLLNKAAGAGVMCHAYTQTDADIDVGFGSNTKDSTKALVAKGNFRTIGCMRVGSQDTAKFFISRVNDVQVKASISDTKMTDSDSPRQGVSAATADRIIAETVPLIDAQSLMRLPVGQFFLAKNGGQIFKCRTPLLNDDLKKSVGSIEVRDLGKMIKDINLGQFVFWDELSLEVRAAMEAEHHKKQQKKQQQKREAEQAKKREQEKEVYKQKPINFGNALNAALKNQDNSQFTHQQEAAMAQNEKNEKNEKSKKNDSNTAAANNDISEVETDDAEKEAVSEAQLAFEREQAEKWKW